MNMNRIEGGLAEEMALTFRKVWTRPSVTPLRAGAAEAIPGARISDATLETIGS
jgi:hypothetical protein